MEALDTYGPVTLAFEMALIEKRSYLCSQDETKDILCNSSIQPENLKTV